MNNRHRRVARLKKQELNERGISTAEIVKAKKSFETAMPVYSLTIKEAEEAMKSFKLALYGIPKVTASLGKIFRGK